jgi:nucleotide-binding universal stress UspA family protein
MLKGGEKAASAPGQALAIERSGRSGQEDVMKIQRVLCPTDFSECSLKALRHAAAIAQWYGAQFHVLHGIVDIIAPVPPIGLPMPIIISPETDANALQTLRDWVGEAGLPGDEPVLAVRKGNTVTAILDYAAEMASDLIVLGTHGRTGVDRVLIGSVAERVLQRAPCPVLTIPPGAAIAAEHPAVAFKQILCAVDASETSHAALALALSVAQENQAELMLLHVLETLTEEEALPLGHYRVGEYLELRKCEALAKLQTFIPENARAWCEPQVRVELGAAARTILDTARDWQADLIVMGAQAHGALSVAVFGSTTQTVVRRASVPVLTVRAAKRQAAAA